MSEFPLAPATLEGEDFDAGRMFDVPRVAVEIDKADPNVLKLSFSGSIELDRDNAKQVEFYNALHAGRETEIVITVAIAGATQRHRRDDDGYVESIVQTKSLVVTDVHLERAE